MSWDSLPLVSSPINCLNCNLPILHAVHLLSQLLTEASPAHRQPKSHGHAGLIAGKRLGLWLVLPCQLIVMIGLVRHV